MLRTCHLLSVSPAKSPDLPQPPVIGKVSHHSIEMSWMNEENKSRTGPPEHWTHFSVEQMDPKTHTFSSIYMSVSQSLSDLSLQLLPYLNCLFSNTALFWCFITEGTAPGML